MKRKLSTLQNRKGYKLLALALLAGMFGINADAQSSRSMSRADRSQRSNAPDVIREQRTPRGPDQRTQSQPVFTPRNNNGGNNSTRPDQRQPQNPTVNNPQVNNNGRDNSNRPDQRVQQRPDQQTQPTAQTRNFPGNDNNTRPDQRVQPRPDQQRSQPTSQTRNFPGNDNSRVDRNTNSRPANDNRFDRNNTTRNDNYRFDRNNTRPGNDNRFDRNYNTRSGNDNRFDRNNNRGFTPRSESRPSNWNRPAYNAYNPGWRYSSLPRRNSVVVNFNFGYQTINYGGYGYRYYDGVFYRPYNNNYIVVAPPIGLYINILPFGYRTVYVRDYPYYYYNGTYYDHYNDSYRVVAPPLGAIVESIPEGYETIVINGETYYKVDGVQYKPTVMDNGEIWYEVIKIDY